MEEAREGVSEGWDRDPDPDVVSDDHDQSGSRLFFFSCGAVRCGAVGSAACGRLR
jgi:hypothetical protein